MKIPKDSPTKEGQRVQHRGRDRRGLIASRTRSASWFWVKWDDRPNEQLCHQGELQVIDCEDEAHFGTPHGHPDTSDIPETGEDWFKKAALKRPANYADLPPQEQWDIDKQLGILDWDGKP